MNNKILTQSLSTFRIVLISSLTIFTLYTVQAWVSPLVSAPNGNVGGPLTTATSTQVKTGSLGLLDNLSIGNNLIVNGNLGVGTTTPSTQLDVENSQNAATYIRSGNINAGSAAIAGLAMHSQGGSSYIFRTSNAATQGNATVIQDQIGPIIFNTASEAMRILNSGNVGIGTTTPAQKLSVAGNIKASGTICDGSNNCVAAGGAHGKQRFTTVGAGVCPSATNCFTVPDGVTTVWVTMSGGGGGGGQAGVAVLGNFSAGNGGGGAAAVIAEKLTVVPLISYTVDVGAGGPSGSSGGFSKFGSLFTASGGLGGPGGGAGGPGGSKGAGGSMNGPGGSGGSSIFGSGAGGNGGVGGAGSGFGGAGAGGGCVSCSGGSGASGFVLVEW